MQKTLSAEELWPVKGFDDLEALDDFIREVTGFIRKGYGLNALDALIDIVYSYDSIFLSWLIRSMLSIKNDNVSADDIKKLVRKILDLSNTACIKEKNK